MVIKLNIILYRREKMGIIYQPKGKAREYSPLAANLYMGCNHGCKYCYAPAIRFKKRFEYLTPIPRRNLLKEFEDDCIKNTGNCQQVQFCFMTDPYNEIEQELRLTRECLKIALKYKVPISILTKSKTVINDLDIIKEFGKNIKIGFTLTFDNQNDSLEWEPGAALPSERIESLKILHENNVMTWASFEPVIIPEQSISMIKECLNFVDLFKIGKLNNFQGLDKKINWNDFLIKAVEYLRSNNKNLYIKYDLRQFANGFKLYGNEMNMDEFNLFWDD